MSLDATADRRDEAPSGNGVAAAVLAPAPLSAVRASYGDRRLRLNPNKAHKPDAYEDVQSEFDPSIFCSLERHLPPSMLEAPRDAKLAFMREILSRYLPEGDRARVQRHKEYRQSIMSTYQPLHKELYNINSSSFFVPSFIEAIKDNTEESFRKIISEPSPGVHSFAMLQPGFCELLASEVHNFEKWVTAVKFKTMRPNTMNKYGTVLDDLGFEAMLNKLMEEFICPMSKVFFPEVGGSTLDSHHGYIVEYGKDKDLKLAFVVAACSLSSSCSAGSCFCSVSDYHVDDSEVTLNVCLGKQFTGGELFFRGVRCDQHVNSEAHPEEIIEYSHVPGQAVLHHGRHRHGVRPTISGHRINLIMWCRSSTFREMKKYQKDFSNWCGHCQREKRVRQRQCLDATKSAFLRTGGSTS